MSDAQNVFPESEPPQSTHLEEREGLRSDIYTAIEAYKFLDEIKDSVLIMGTDLEADVHNAKIDCLYIVNSSLKILTK